MDSSGDFHPLSMDRDNFSELQDEAEDDPLQGSPGRVSKLIQNFEQNSCEIIEDEMGESTMQESSVQGGTASVGELVSLFTTSRHGNHNGSHLTNGSTALPEQPSQYPLNATESNNGHSMNGDVKPSLHDIVVKEGFQLSQHPMEDSSTVSQLSQYPLGASDSESWMVLSQNPMQDTQFTSMSAVSQKQLLQPEESDTISRKLSRSEEFITVRDHKSSELRISQPGVGSREKTVSMSSGESSDPMAMFSTRPGTAIEMIDSGRGTAGVSGIFSPNDLIEDVHIQDASSHFAHSIQFQHGSARATLCDSLSHAQNNPVFASTPDTQSKPEVDLDNDKPIPLASAWMVQPEDFAATAEMFYPIDSISGEQDMGSRGTSRASSTGSQDRIFIADNGVFSEGRTKLPEDVGESNLPDSAATKQEETAPDQFTADDGAHAGVSRSGQNDAVINDLSNATGDTDSLMTASAGFTEQVDETSSAPGGDRSSFTMVSDLEQASLGSREALFALDPSGSADPTASVLNQSENRSQKSGSEGSLSDRVALILSQMPKQDMVSDVESGQNKKQDVLDAGDDNSDEEIERITSEYNEVLKARLAAFSDTDSNVSGLDGKASNAQSPGDEINTSTKSLSHSETQTSPHVPYDEIEITTTTSRDGATSYSSRFSERKLSKGSDSGTDDTLDQDVKKILAKYGRTLSESDDEQVRRPVRGHVGSSSGDETDDLKHWVSGLLYGKPGDDEQSTLSPQVTGSNIPTYLFDDPAKSMSLPMELQTASQESMTTSIDLQRSKPTGDKPVPKAFPSHVSDDASSVSDDQLSTKVRQLLRDTRYGEAAELVSCTKSMPSKTSSRTSSVSGSVDLNNLEKDLDEIEMSLGHLKNTKEIVHRSEQNSEPSQLNEQSQLDEQSLGSEWSQHDDISQGSEKYRRTQLENSYETENSSTYRYVPPGRENQPGDSHTLERRIDSFKHTPISEQVEVDHSDYPRPSGNAYLDNDQRSGNLHLDNDQRSGNVFLDNDQRSDNVYLDNDQRSGNLHLDNDKGTEDIPSQYVRSRYRSDLPQPVNNIKKTDLGVHALLTSGVIPLDIALDIVHGYPEATKRLGDSYESRISPGRNLYTSTSPLRYDADGVIARSRIYNRHETLAYDSPEKSSSVINPALSNDAKSPYTTSNASGDIGDSAQQQGETSVNYEPSPHIHTGVTPESFSPLRAFSNVKNLFTSHMDKVTRSTFDKSLELGTPYRQPMSYDSLDEATRKLDENRRSSSLKGRVCAVPSDERTMFDYQREIQTDPGTNVYKSVGVTPTQSMSLQDFRSVSGIESSHQHTPDVRSDDSHVTTHSVSPIAAANLQPYKPVGSQEMYYVESGTDDGQSTVVMSESTTESTHLGSDDARGPRFPASVLGTRSDDTNGVEGIYYKEKTEDPVLTTILEQPSLDSRDAESGKSKSDESIKSKKEEEKERSLLKARDWIAEVYNGESTTPKVTPRDGCEHHSLQDEIQPQDAIDGGRLQAEQKLPSKKYQETTNEYKDTDNFGTPKKSQEKSRNWFNSEHSGGNHQSRYSSESNAPETVTDRASSSWLSPESSLSPAWSAYKTAASPHEEVTRHTYKPGSEAIDYVKLQYQAGRFQLSPPTGSGSLVQSYRGIEQNSDDSFQPLEAEQEHDESTEHKTYPTTPYPQGLFTNSASQYLKSQASDMSLDSSVPSRYFLSDGRVIMGSPGSMERSILSDQLGISGGGVNHAVDRERSPMRYGRELAAISMGKYPIGREIRDAVNAGFVSGSRSPQHPMERPDYGSYRSHHSPEVIGEMSYNSTSSKPQDLSPSRRLHENYSEERLQQRMQYVMARLGPEMDNLPADLNDKWDRYMEVRSRSEANSSGHRSMGVDESVEQTSERSTPEPQGGGSMLRNEVRNSCRYDTAVTNQDDRVYLKGYSRSQNHSSNKAVSGGIGRSQTGQSNTQAVTGGNGKNTSQSINRENISDMETPDLSPHLHTSAYEEQDTEELLQPDMSVTLANGRQAVEQSANSRWAEEQSANSRRAEEQSANSRRAEEQSANSRQAEDQSANSRRAVEQSANSRRALEQSANNRRVEEQSISGPQSHNRGVASALQYSATSPQRSNTTQENKQSSVAASLRNDVSQTRPVVSSTRDVSRNINYPMLKTQETQTSDQEDSAREKSAGVDPCDCEKPKRSVVRVLIGEQTSEQVRQAEAKKTAYLIKDETLASVPEDSTLDSISSDFTTSSYETDGKIILKTTKRHLPDDPKLLRLQHKILKQKEKYKHERVRELKRKEKIVTMERVLAEQKLDGGKVPRHSKSGELRASSMRTPKKSSTPSAHKQISWSSSSDSTVVTVSDITSSTITQSSFMSDDLTLTEAKDTSPERSVHDQSTQQSMETSHVCTCQSASRHKDAQRPPRLSASPTRRELKDAVQEMRSIQLQVSSSRDLTTPSARHRSGLYMEFDKPRSHRSPKRSRQNKENSHYSNEHKQHKKHKEQQNERKQKASKSCQNTSGSIDMRDFGQTCPSPIIVSQHERQKNNVNKVTRAVQTQKLSGEMELSHSTNLINPRDKNNRRRSERPWKDRKKDASEFSAGKCGLAWFVPMGEPRPWRRPLRERQAYAAAMDTYPDISLMSRKQGLMSRDWDQRTAACDEEATSLQVAFENHMYSFVSRSRERQRLVSLRAEERYIQDLHQTQRDQLFAVKRKMEANINAHPMCDQHFQPQKRSFSKKHMIQQTKKLYKKLPEIKQQVEEKKREETYKTNRLRARLFNQKVQCKVLNKTTGWVQ